MASPRLAGASWVTSRPSIEMVPPLTSSRPAISLSKVDLPQPEGPTKTTNSASPMSRSIDGMMVVAPNDFDTFWRWIFAISSSRSFLFHGTEGEAADQLALREPAHDEDRRDRQRRGRRQLRPEQAFRAREGGDEGGERRGIGCGEPDRPERLVPGEDDVEQHGRGDAGHRHRGEHMDDLVEQRGAVHARGLEDLARDLAEI